LDHPGRRSVNRAGDLITLGGGLTTRFWVMHKLAPVALGLSSGRDPVRRSSPQGCSRLATPPRMSQAAAGMKREWNWCLEERIRAKGIKTKMY
jgi:hypothetical protein